MKKIGIINTSTGCTDYLNHGYNIKTARMRVVMGDKSYLDYTELTADKFFDMLEENPEILPSSSTPNYVEFQDLIKEFEDEGCEEVIIITISSNLSASYSIAVNAAEEYEGNVKITVYDSKKVALPEGYVAIEAAKLAEEGKKVQEIIEKLDRIHDNQKIFFVVDSLRLLIKNGRLSNASGFIGTALKIKPILEIDEEGKIQTLMKVRSTKKALRKLVDHFHNEVKEIEDFTILIHTSNNPEAEKFIQDEVAKYYPNKEVLIAPVTPVIGCHADAKVVAVGYVKK
ncbi:DegV family protein [Mycoplasmatota bacterium zrk1]